MSVRRIFRSPVLELEAFPVVGRGGEPGEHVRLRMPDWVCVVAETARAEVVLVRQPRSGTGRSHLEAPGGVVEPGEPPLQTARRELREETGYEAASWSALGAVFPNPALQDNRCFLYLAEGAVRTGEPTPDPFERLTVELGTWEQVGRWLSDGAIDHALAVVALQRVLLARCGRMAP